MSSLWLIVTFLCLMPCPFCLTWLLQFLYWCPCWLYSWDTHSTCVCHGFGRLMDLPCHHPGLLLSLCCNCCFGSLCSCPGICIVLVSFLHSLLTARSTSLLILQHSSNMAALSWSFSTPFNKFILAYLFRFLGIVHLTICLSESLPLLDANRGNMSLMA